MPKGMKEKRRKIHPGEVSGRDAGPRPPTPDREVGRPLTSAEKSYKRLKNGTDGCEREMPQRDATSTIYFRLGERYNNLTKVASAVGKTRNKEGVYLSGQSARIGTYSIKTWRGERVMKTVKGKVLSKENKNVEVFPLY